MAAFEASAAPLTSPTGRKYSGCMPTRNPLLPTINQQTNNDHFDMRKHAKKTLTHNEEDLPPPTPPTSNPTESDLFDLSNVYNELVITHGVLVEGRFKRQNSINFFERHEAQNLLPNNLRFQLAMNQWPICFNQDEAAANHLIEMKILNEALKAIASNRKNILKIDLKRLQMIISTMSEPFYFKDYIEENHTHLSHLQLALEDQSANFHTYVTTFDYSSNRKRTSTKAFFDQLQGQDNDEFTSNAPTDNDSQLTSLADSSGDLFSIQNLPGKKLSSSKNKQKRRKQGLLPEPLPLLTASTLENIITVPDVTLSVPADDSISQLTALVRSLTSTVESYKASNRNVSGNRGISKTQFPPEHQHSTIFHQHPPTSTSQVARHHHKGHVQGSNSRQGHLFPGTSTQNVPPFYDNLHLNYSSSSNNTHHQLQPMPHHNNHFPHPPSTPQHYNNIHRSY